MAQKIVNAVYATPVIGVDPPPQVLAAGQAFGIPAGMSADGRYVVLTTTEALRESDTNDTTDFYLYDRDNKTYTLITVGQEGGKSRPA